MMFCDVFFPFCNIERLLGLLPLPKFTMTHTHCAMFDSKWPVVLYSLSVYGAFLYTCVVVGTVKVQLLHKGQGRFGLRMEAYLSLVVLCTAVAVPLTHWVHAVDVCRHIALWQHFEGAFRSLTSQENRLNMKKQIIVAKVGLPLYVVGVFSSILVYGGGTDASSVVVGCFVATVNYMNVATLWIHSQTLVQTAANFRHILYAEVLSGTPAGLASPAFHRRLELWGALWLVLSRMAQNTALALTSRLLHLHLDRCVRLTLTIYWLVTSLNASLVWACLLLLLELHVVRDQTEDLLNKLQYYLEDVESRRKVFILLDVISYNHPALNLAGFFTVNRRLLTSVILTLTTYLIVLVQFRVGLNYED